MTHRFVYLAAATLLLAASGGTATAAPGVECRSIAANGGWQSTGIMLAEGDAVCIAGRGVWSHGPESGAIAPWHGPSGYLYKKEQASPPIVPFPFAKVGALIGKLGETGLAFPIEAGLCFVVQASDDLPADLYLAMNDAPASFEDNRGALRVAIATDASEALAGGRGTIVDRLAQETSRGHCLR